MGAARCDVDVAVGLLREVDTSPIPGQAYKLGTPWCSVMCRHTALTRKTDFGALTR